MMEKQIDAILKENRTPDDSSIENMASTIMQPELNSAFHFNKEDDVKEMNKEIMSDFEHSHHFHQASREFDKARRIYHNTLSRLES